MKQTKVRRKNHFTFTMPNCRMLLNVFLIVWFLDTIQVHGQIISVNTLYLPDNTTNSDINLNTSNIVSTTIKTGINSSSRLLPGRNQIHKGTLSQEAMDIITVVWYISTFLALAAFFFLMACSDRKCGRTRIQSESALQAPPTPAPSYSEFAPPSYDSVMKQLSHVYVLPVRQKVLEMGNQYEKIQSSGIRGIPTTLSPSSLSPPPPTTPPPPPTPVVITIPTITSFHTLNELQKFNR